MLFIDENERVHPVVVVVVVRPSTERTTSLIGVSVDRLHDAAAHSTAVVLVVVAYPVILEVTSVVVVELVVVVLMNKSLEKNDLKKRFSPYTGHLPKTHYITYYT